MKTISNSIIQELNKIQKEFIWKTRNPKIKHDTLNYENAGLKNVDIMYKVVSLQCSWIKRLYDNSSHNWKVIPLHMIIQKLGKKFLFHSNLDVSSKQINHFPQYYQEIFKKWSSNLSVSPNSPSTITSQIIWFNKHIKIDNKSLCNNSLANQGVNHVGQLFKENGMTKAWLDIKTLFNLSNKQHYFWIQLINAIPKSWKEELRRNNRISDALSVYDHHLIKSNQTYSLNKCNSKELYRLQISLNNSKTRSQLYFEDLIQKKDIDWKHVYLLPRRVTVDTNLRIFQLKS